MTSPPAPVSTPTTSITTDHSAAVTLPPPISTGPSAASSRYSRLRRVGVHQATTLAHPSISSLPCCQPDLPVIDTALASGDPACQPVSLARFAAGDPDGHHCAVPDRVADSQAVVGDHRRLYDLLALGQPRRPVPRPVEDAVWVTLSVHRWSSALT